jgi:hypothetical protein
VKIVDLARAGEFDADELTDLVLADFDNNEPNKSAPTQAAPATRQWLRPGAHWSSLGVVP